jgi:hypothetical protein
VLCRLAGIDAALNGATNQQVRGGTRRSLTKRVGRARGMVTAADRIGGGAKAARRLRKARGVLGGFVKSVRAGQRKRRIDRTIGGEISGLAREARSRLVPLEAAIR